MRATTERTPTAIRLERRMAVTVAAQLSRVAVSGYGRRGGDSHLWRGLGVGKCLPCDRGRPHMLVSSPVVRAGET
jgi:hypothetical protein